MSRFRAWAVAAALAAGAGAPAVAADPPAAAADTRPLYKRMFFAPKPAPPAEPAARTGATAAPPGQAPTQPLSPDAVRAALQAEQDAYLRRLNVCVELRKAAEQRGDEPLMRQVDELERQAEAVYKRRIAALGVSRTVRAPLPQAGAGFAASLDLAPEKPADPKAAAARLAAPAAPVPVAGAATAEVREVQP